MRSPESRKNRSNQVYQQFRKRGTQPMSGETVSLAWHGSQGEGGIPTMWGSWERVLMAADKSDNRKTEMYVLDLGT